MISLVAGLETARLSKSLVCKWLTDERQAVTPFPSFRHRPEGLESSVSLCATLCLRAASPFRFGHDRILGLGAEVNDAGLDCT